jgi:hypothetical protein
MPLAPSVSRSRAVSFFSILAVLAAALGLSLPAALGADWSLLRISGRHDASRPEGPVLYYAGSAVHVRFEGPSLRATVRDLGSFADTQQVGFIIDDGEQRLFTLPKNSTRTFDVATGLADGVHTLVLFKLANPGGNASGLQLLDLELAPGKNLLPAAPLPPDTLRLEFFGDSFTAGSETGLARTDNGWNSFPNVAARLLGAELHNNGIGGLSVLDDTGYYQTSDAAPLNTGFVTTYDKLNPSRWMNGGYTPWDLSRYTPDLVVFGFGINDSYGRGGFPDPATWKAAYKTVVRTLADTYGKSRTTLVLHPANLWNNAYEHGPALVAELVAEGYRAHWFRFSFDITAHPDTAEARRMGEEFAAFVRTLDQTPETPPPAPAPPGPGLIDDQHPALTYSGSWTSFATGRDDQRSGTEHETNNSGASVELTFSGTGIKLLARTRPWGASAVTVTLDGQPEGTVSLRADPGQSDNVIYSRQNLADTTHTVRFTLPSAGDYIFVDAFEITRTTPADSTYTAWIDDHAASLGGATAPGDDPDADGLANLLEYALGGDPALAGERPAPALVASSATDGTPLLGLAYRRLRGGSAPTANDYLAGGLRYLIESTTDLSGAWTSAPEDFSAGAPLPVDERHELITVTSTIPAHPPLFLRLRVAPHPGILAPGVTALH